MSNSQPRLYLAAIRRHSLNLRFGGAGLLVFRRREARPAVIFQNPEAFVIGEKDQSVIAVRQHTGHAGKLLQNLRLLRIAEIQPSRPRPRLARIPRPRRPPNQRPHQTPTVAPFFFLLYIPSFNRLAHSNKHPKNNNHSRQGCINAYVVKPYHQVPSHQQGA